MDKRSDTSGQVMLTSAFLLAIVLTFIALMLNNIIYYNNIAYTGFMGHAGNEDTSIKNIMSQEAIYAYDESHGDLTVFNRHMQDLVDSLNNVTLSEGRYVVYTPPAGLGGWDTTTTHPAASFSLTISSKESNRTFAIATNYVVPVAPTPTPTPAPIPQNCIVTVSSPMNNSGVLYTGGNNHTSLLIKVKDMSSNPLGNVVVNLDSMLGVFYFDENMANLIDSTINPVITDPSTGMAIVYYYPISPGTAVLNASVGMIPSRSAGNLSNNVIITNDAWRTCTHNAIIGSPMQLSGGGNYKQKIGNTWYYWTIFSIPITVPGPQTPDYNFSSFSVGAVFNSFASTNLALWAPADLGSYTVPGYLKGPGAYNGNLNMKLYVNNKDQPFNANFEIIITGYCNEDKATYTNTETFAISGTWN